MIWKPSGFVDQALNLSDRGVIDGANRLATAWALNRPLKTHSLVGDVQGAAADRTACLSHDIVKFMSHRRHYMRKLSHGEAQSVGIKAKISNRAKSPFMTKRLKSEVMVFRFSVHQSV